MIPGSTSTWCNRDPLTAPSTTERGGNRLYRNRGDGTFEDVTTTARVGGAGYGIGVAVADYDRDGWVDLYVTNLGPDVLYRNNGRGADGSVSFHRRHRRSRSGRPGYSTSAAFFDFDRDRDLDLYVCNYLEWSPRTEHLCLGFNGVRGYCRPGEYSSQSDTLYRNDGIGPNGRVLFTDVSERAGMRAVEGPGPGRGDRRLRR